VDRTQRIVLGAVLLATAVSVAMCVRRGAEPRKKSARGTDPGSELSGGPGAEDDREPDDPNDPDEPEQLDDAAPRSTASPGPTQTATTTTSPPIAPGKTKVEQLEASVLREAVRANWVTIDDKETPCPPDRVRILYSPPSNLKQYKKGAYFEPLGPSPGEAVDEVNGLLICDGHNFLYRGFEAYFRADRGQWDVFPFPVIEE
jgi:hypothetical protein